MSRRPFYKRYPADWLMATRDLAPDERIAYADCVDLMYMRGRPIPDDARFLAGFIGLSVRRWNRIRASLIAAGKLIERGEYLSNERFEREVEAKAEWHEKAVEWGSIGGQRRAAQARAQAELPLASKPPKSAPPPAKSGTSPKPSLENSERGENPATAKQSQALSPRPPLDEPDDLEALFDDISDKLSGRKTPDKSREKIQTSDNNPMKSTLGSKPARAYHIPESPIQESENNRESMGGISKGGKSLNGQKPARIAPADKPRLKSKRARPLPKAWTPAPLANGTAALIARWPPGKLEHELEKFLDYARDKGRTALDWNAAWRNWIRKEHEQHRRTDARSRSAFGFALGGKSGA